MRTRLLAALATAALATAMLTAPAAGATTTANPRVTTYKVCDGNLNCLNNNGNGQKVQAVVGSGQANYELSGSQDPCPGIGSGTTCYELHWVGGGCLEGQSDGTVLTETCTGGEAQLWTRDPGGHHYLLNVYHVAHGGAYILTDNGCMPNSNAFLTSSVTGSCAESWSLDS